MTPSPEPFVPRVDGWRDEDQVAEYLDRIERLPPRAAGEDVLREILPPAPVRLLDLGAGDGRLAALAMEARPTLEHVVLVDRSAPMLERARRRFAGDARVEVRSGELEEPIGPLGTFDVVVSGLAIHHLHDPAKRRLYGQVAQQLEPGGLFANLEVVASATPELHATFLRAIGRAADDPDDRLAPAEAQLGWLREAGLVQVDCLWRWRGFALLVGVRPGA